jgi:hypothetical protein
MNSMKINPDNVNPLLARLRDRAKLSEWLMRYYFNDNRTDAIWYRSDVNEDNVLAYVSDPRSNFPLSPADICDDWNIKKSLKSDFAAIDFDAVAAKPVKGKKEAIYNTGDVSLKDIGQELHGITAMMALKLETSGTAKMQLMTGKNRDGMEAAMERISQAHREVADAYATLLLSCKSVNTFLDAIKKAYQITPLEMEDIKTNRELKMIQFLMSQDATDIADYLRGDILKQDNRMKSFQTMISKHLYPSKKRGRPKKNAN